MIGEIIAASGVLGMFGVAFAYWSKSDRTPLRPIGEMLGELDRIVAPAPPEGWYLWEARIWAEGGPWWHFPHRYDDTEYAWPKPTQRELNVVRSWKGGPQPIPREWPNMPMAQWPVEIQRSWWEGRVHV